MKQFDPSLSPNQSITNKKMQDIFKCAKQGGMRRSHQTNTLVVIADHTRPLYKDRWDNNVTFGLWLCHAWVWEYNPDGVFTDLNPNVE